jgi:mono/diheme cytochrome c family protein
VTSSFSKTLFILTTILFASSAWADETHTAAHDVGKISEIAGPFFKEHCIRCHGESEAKGELRLDQLDSDLNQPATFERWRKIVQRVQAGEMPPEKENQPKPEQAADLVKHLMARLDAVAAARWRFPTRVTLTRYAVAQNFAGGDSLIA